MLTLIRLVGVWFLLLAMVAAGIAASKALAAGGPWVVRPMGEQWKALNAQSLDVAKAWFTSNAGPYLWARIFTPILHAPTWVVFGTLGVLLYWFGQKRKPVE